ncbi:DNA-directed RNA polymerase [Ciborinia camelliae]|nr:DNA-directed RNA polymerase [Ciborinia camelliae]
MLVRAAGRKARGNPIVDRLKRQQTYLPFLYPSINSNQTIPYRNIHVDSTPQVTGLRKRRNPRENSTKPPSRSLATAVDQPIEELPFEELYDNPPPNNYTPYHLPKLQSPIIISDDGEFAPHRHRRGGYDAVGGTSDEVIALLDACLQVGRIERASVIFKRITQMPEISRERLLVLQNQYLRAAVQEIMMNPSEQATQSLHKWFELEVRNKNLPQDALTVVYMLKASLQSPPGPRRDRLVSRYMDMVQGDAGLEVLASNVLSPEELNTINHICPTYNLAEGLGYIENMFNSEKAIPPVADAFDGVLQYAEKKSAPVPEVLQTHQKGLGLKSLRKTLSLFSTLPSAGYDMSKMNEQQHRAIQTQLEEDAVQAAIDRWRDESSNLAKMGLNTTLQSKSLGARMWKWHIALTELLKEELKAVDEAESKKIRTVEEISRCEYGPFLRYLPAEKLAALTIIAHMHALTASGIDKGLTLSYAILQIAKNIEDESIFESIQKNKEKPLWRDSVADRTRMLRLLKSKARGASEESVDINDPTSFATEDFISSQIRAREWSIGIRARVGSFLLESLLKVAKVPVILEHPETKEIVTQMQPAFSHAQQYRLGKKLGVINANKVIVEQLKREPVHSLLAKHLPMLVKPAPWTGFSCGGFLRHPGRVMRVKNGDKDQRNYADAAIDQGKLTTVFKALNILGDQSWRINQPVFDVMLDAWNSGDAVANLAPHQPKLEYPPEPETTSDPLERRRWVTAVKKVENAKGGFHSQRCFQNFQLEIARALRDKTFYFPHNVDFRGRAYPIPPYLNHMGADHCRGLMLFGVGKELGPSGLMWLKVHLANVHGFDKASLKEREDFANRNIDEIYDSATNPLGGNKWWLKAEDPWQCLAACMEIRNALDSGDPTRFVSYLPVHQDGTCNGLQHYAALGGDVWGAQQVNLEPGDRPADVYTAVADLVKESIATDLLADHPKAKILDGKITRKVVKQTVMTNVYGVTFVGAKAQVRKQLVAAYKDLPDDDEINPGNLASYVVTKIFTALSTMFRGAHDIQYWLGDCASRISRSLTPEQLERIVEHDLKPSHSTRLRRGAPTLDDISQFKSSVIWTTPLNMPVVQPYRTHKSRQIVTNLQNLSLSEPHRSDPVSGRKQLQGFPPNFIHSLDATHMLLSAVKSNEAKLSFAAVHDSFWTHAADVDTMNTILRDAFIEIHSDDVIGRLAAEMATRYKGYMQLVRVRPGTLAHTKIAQFRKSLNLVGRAKHTELVMEMKRLRLLRSSNPEEVKKGRAMITSASIYEIMTGEVELDPESDVKNMGLGNMVNARSVKEHDTDSTRDTGAAEEGLEEDLEDGLTTEPEAAEENVEEAEPETSISAFEELILGKPRSKKVDSTKPQWVWLPLKFAPVPKKGAFDVSRLKQSQYFFS